MRKQGEKHTCTGEGASIHHLVSGMCEKWVDRDGSYLLHSRRGMHSPVLAEEGRGQLKKKRKKNHNVLLSFPFLEKVNVSNVGG